MSRTLKPYEELVIASDRKIFLRIRRKLTAVYIGIIACILLGYNTLSYLDLRHDIAEAKFYEKTESELTEVPGHAATIPLLIQKIIIEDTIILTLAAWISYLFAGYTLKPVQRSLVLQKNFTGNASHELRTPLAVIKSDAEVLLRNTSPSKEMIETTLRSIIEEVDRMTTMTNDLLLLARSEGQPTIDKKTINLNEQIGIVLAKMNSLAEKEEVHLDYNSPKNTFIIQGDLSALLRVFLNLLQNAITYTPKGGTVTVAIHKDAHCAVVTVRDTGKGISLKDLPHVFERFYKGENSLGTGLGLSIVKEIIDAHQGRISVRSEEGKGVEVSVRLPYILLA